MDNKELILSAPRNNKCFLKINTRTWTRDSHDLYDYESTQYVERDVYASGDVRVLRSGSDIQLFNVEFPLPNTSSDYLLNVKIRDGHYFIHSPDKVLSPNICVKKLWLIVHDLPEERYDIEEGDVIKLGRHKLKVKQLVRQPDSTQLPEILLEDGSDLEAVRTTFEERKMVQCRICLLEGETEDDPLICPCVCRGSIKYVHVECLRNWVNGKLKLQEDSKFLHKQFQCELCKQYFPSVVKLDDGTRIPIFRMPSTQPPFIILENAGSTGAGLWILSMATKKVIKIGRGHESDVRIPDVSISRFHATITFSDGRFTLDDHKSKFGTLVGLRKPHLYISKGRDFSIQVGRSVLKFGLLEEENNEFWNEGAFWKS